MHHSCSLPTGRQGNSIDIILRPSEKTTSPQGRPSCLDFTQNPGKVMDDITFVRSHWWLVSEVFHYRPPTPMYRNSPPLCTIVLQIPSLMPLKMRKVQQGLRLAGTAEVDGRTRVGFRPPPKLPPAFARFTFRLCALLLFRLFLLTGIRVLLTLPAEGDRDFTPCPAVRLWGMLFPLRRPVDVS